MEKCPSFNSCDAPKCPLDEFYDDRVYYTGEPKCVATKRTRVQLGLNMEHFGLLPREYLGYLRIYGSREAVETKLREDFLG